ncbi:MAG: hypothetical protein DMD89_00210 [Candidatus Rokuibacteriota bacterium]|nr:MAG: hypothetical protein DMD89_00210 [Candidatus Rokubacteria bacterium]
MSCSAGTCPARIDPSSLTPCLCLVGRSILRAPAQTRLRHGRRNGHGYREFTVIVEDRPGTLAELGNVLGDAGVNIEAIQG